MSATLKTENYNLPIFAENDFTSWEDYNSAMEIIDAAMEENKNNIGDLNTGQGAADQAIQSLNDSVSSLNSSLQQQNTAISQLSTRMANNESHDEDRDKLIANIQKEINSSNSTIENQLDSLSQSLDQNNNDISNLGTQVSNVKNQLNTTNQELNEMKTNISDIKYRMLSTEYMDELEVQDFTYGNGYIKNFETITKNGKIFVPGKFQKTVYISNENINDYIMRLEGRVIIRCQKVGDGSYERIEMYFKKKNNPLENYGVDNNTVCFGDGFIYQDLTNGKFTPIAPIYYNLNVPQPSGIFFSTNMEKLPIISDGPEVYLTCMMDFTIIKNISL